MTNEVPMKNTLALALLTISSPWELDKGFFNAQAKQNVKPKMFMYKNNIFCNSKLYKCI